MEPGFDNLSNEMIMATLLQMDHLETIISFCQTNRRIQNVCQNEFFWKRKFQRDFDSNSILERGETWQNKYKLKYLSSKRYDSPLATCQTQYAVIDREGGLHIANFQSRNHNPIKINQFGNIRIRNVSCDKLSIIVVTQNGEVYGMGFLDPNLKGNPQYYDKFTKFAIDSKVKKVAHRENHYLFLLENHSVLIDDLYLYGTRDQPKHLLDNIPIEAKDIVVTTGRIEWMSCGGIGPIENYYNIDRYGVIDMDGKFYIIGSLFERWENFPKKEDSEDEYSEDEDSEDEYSEDEYYSWDNYDGELEHLTTIVPHNKPKSVDLPEPVQQVTFGLDYIIFLTTDGNVYGIGSNEYGKLGTRNFGKIYTPRKIELPKKIRQISSSDYANIAISVDGDIYFWGQVGNLFPMNDNILSMKNSLDENIRYTPRPIQISLQPNTEEIKYISLSNTYGLFVTTDGVLNMFG